jgi:hypothetical protein
MGPKNISNQQGLSSSVANDPPIRQLADRDAANHLSYGPDKQAANITSN